MALLSSLVLILLLTWPVPTQGSRPADENTEICLAKCIDKSCTHFGFNLDGRCELFNDTLISVKEYLTKNRDPAATITINSVDFNSSVHGLIRMSDDVNEIMPKIGLLTGEVQSSLTNITNYKMFTADSGGADKLKFMIKLLKPGTIIVGGNSKDVQPSLKGELDYFKSVGLDFGKLEPNGKLAFIFQKGFPTKTILLTKKHGGESLNIKIKIYRPFDKPEPETFYFVGEVNS